jgi:AcrR family transcriptional regulator
VNRTGSGRPVTISGMPLDDRPRSDNGPAATERQIMSATERLLGSTPLAELNVARILTEAGISRATFYAYFTSKYGPVAALLKQTMDAIYDSVGAFTHRSGEGDGPEGLDKGLWPAQPRARRRPDLGLGTHPVHRGPGRHR